MRVYIYIHTIHIYICVYLYTLFLQLLNNKHPCPHCIESQFQDQGLDERERAAVDKLTRHIAGPSVVLPPFEC